MTKNKIFLLFTFVLISALSLTACVRPVSDGSPTPRGTGLLEEILTATLIPADSGDEEDSDSGENMVETAVQETLLAQQTADAESQEDPATPQATATLHIITPTATTETVAEETQPEATEAASAPTKTAMPQPTIDALQINPDQEFTGSQFVDSMDDPTLWYDRSGNLADSDYLKLEMLDGTMYVTGKLRLWDTWWITGSTLTNFYMEMEVNSGDCSGSDTYGMILRASQHNQPTRGYLIGFTCDGKVYAKRLDSVSPYVAVSILNPTETELIYSGANQTNILGVAFDGNTISIYPNRYYFTTIQDSTFSSGRYGIYVQAGDKGNYNFTVDEIRSWGIID
jgi:hypothetical protein